LSAMTAGSLVCNFTWRRQLPESENSCETVQTRLLRGLFVQSPQEIGDHTQETPQTDKWTKELLSRSLSGGSTARPRL
jgi:hypothetical protein